MPAVTESLIADGAAIIGFSETASALRPLYDFVTWLRAAHGEDGIDAG